MIVPWAHPETSSVAPAVTGPRSTGWPLTPAALGSTTARRPTSGVAAAGASSTRAMTPRSTTSCHGRQRESKPTSRSLPMTTYSAQTAPGPTGTNGGGPDHAHEIYERLLALSNQVGAAYLEAYEKAAAGIGDFQEMLALGGLPDWFDAGAAWQTAAPTGDIPAPLHD